MNGQSSDLKIVFKAVLLGLLVYPFGLMILFAGFGLAPAMGSLGASVLTAASTIVNAAFTLALFLVLGFAISKSVSRRRVFYATLGGASTALILVVVQTVVLSLIASWHSIPHSWSVSLIVIVSLPLVATAVLGGWVASKRVTAAADRAAQSHAP